MKKLISNKVFKGSISLEIKSSDTIVWKLAMLFEAANSDEQTIEVIAKKYGYTREHFYIIKKIFEEKGSQGLVDKKSGPKTNYKRTKANIKQVILHRFLDPEASCDVITQKMQQAGINISQRSVERTINEYSLQKKSYIKQIRKMNKKK